MKTTILFATLLFSIITNAQTFTLKSQELGGQSTNREVLNGFGCTGENDRHVDYK